MKILNKLFLLSILLFGIPINSMSNLKTSIVQKSIKNKKFKNRYKQRFYQSRPHIKGNFNKVKKGALLSLAGTSVLLYLTNKVSAQPKISQSDNSRELELSKKLSDTNYPIVRRDPDFKEMDTKWQTFIDSAYSYLDEGQNPDIVIKVVGYYPVTLLEIAARLAVENNNWSLLKKMAEVGANFNFIGGMNGYEFNQESILWKAYDEYEPSRSANVIKFLLTNGADPIQKGGSKITPLHFFAIYGKSLEVLEVLLENLKEKNIDTNLRDKYGNTPIMSLIKNSSTFSLESESKWDVIENKLDILLKYGADLSLKNDEGDDVFELLNKTPPLSSLPSGVKSLIRESLKKSIYNK